MGEDEIKKLKDEVKELKAQVAILLEWARAKDPVTPDVGPHLSRRLRHG